MNNNKRRSFVGDGDDVGLGLEGFDLSMCGRRQGLAVVVRPSESRGSAAALGMLQLTVGGCGQ